MENRRGGGYRGRGQRGHRGQRHGHQHGDRYRERDNDRDDEYEPGMRGGRGRGRPPGLRGKDIGLFYAKRGKEKREREERNHRQYIQMDKGKEENISRLLQTIRSGDDCPKQSDRSYRDPRDAAGGSDSDDNSGCHGNSVKSSSSSRGGFRDDDGGRYGKTRGRKGSHGDWGAQNESGARAGGSQDDWFDKPAAPADSGPGWYVDLGRSTTGGGSDRHGPVHGSGHGAGHQNRKRDVPKTSWMDSDSEPEEKMPIAPVRGSSDPSGGGTGGGAGWLGATGRDGANARSDVSDDDDDDVSDDDATLGPDKATRGAEDMDMDQSEGEDEREDGAEDEDEEEEEEERAVTQVSELFRYNEEVSDFMVEFHEHRAANRNSIDNLQDAGSAKKSLARDPHLDQKLLKEKANKEQNDSKYRRMLEGRKRLPSYQMKEKVVDMITDNQVVVVSGETGCGKTTQVPQFILDDYIERQQGSLCRVVCTQPRRISAISVAERVADERAESCGAGSVGFQIRLEHKRPRSQGSILYCTTGIMLKWLASDPYLSETTHVILDEIHERDLQSDFLMIILRDLIKRRPDLKLVLMSATLNAEMFSQYYGGCPMLNIPGFTYPVKEYLLEDIIQMTRYRHGRPPVKPRPRGRIHGANKRAMMEREEELRLWMNRLPNKYSNATKDVLSGLDCEEIDIDLAAHLVDYIIRERPEGAILVFMPGWDQIKKLNEALSNNPMFKTGRFLVIPLHSLMPTVNQRQVFERPPPGVRKIVIATNIAETSITIDDVVYVVDCGKIKMKNFDAENNIGTLLPEWVSKANAKQRRGRAGRVQPGECFHENTLQDYQLPEILRTRLEELCLQIKLLKLGRIEPFIRKAMQPPSMEALHAAVTTLRNLNALDEHEDLTPLGYHLAKMPVDPQTGKMLLFGAMFSCLDPILTVAASLSFKDAFHIPLVLK